MHCKLKALGDYKDDGTIQMGKHCALNAVSSAFANTQWAYFRCRCLSISFYLYIFNSLFSVERMHLPFAWYFFIAISSWLTLSASSRIGFGEMCLCLCKSSSSISRAKQAQMYLLSNSIRFLFKCVLVFEFKCKRVNTCSASFCLFYSHTTTNIYISMALDWWS